MENLVSIYTPNKKIKEYAQQIDAHWRSALTSILDVGKVLNVALEDVGRKEWVRMVDNVLPFTRRTAEKLVKISNDPRLSNVKYAEYLPPHWTSLHELTFLSDDKFEDGIDKGIISADADRKDIVEFVKSGSDAAERTATKKPKQSTAKTNFQSNVADDPSSMRLATITSSDYLADWQFEAFEKALKTLCKKHKVEFEIRRPSLEKIELGAKRKELGDKTEKWLTDRAKTYNVSISQEEQDLLLDALYQMENKKYPLNTDPNSEFAANDIRNPKHKYHGERKGTLYPYCQKHKIVNRYATIETVDYEAFCETFVLQHCRGNARARDDAHQKLLRRSNSPNPRNAKFAKAALAKLIV